MKLTIIILIILILVCLFIIRNLMKKQEQAEDILVGYFGYLDKLSRIIEVTDEKLKQIDSKGTFESDDEIGFFFKNVKELQEVLNEFNVKKIEPEK